MNVPGQVGDIISTGLMGFWGFLGVVMRGTADWRDSVTGKFSGPKFGVSIATALVMGQVAAAIGAHLLWEPAATCALASTLAYLGPAVAIQLFMKRFLGDQNVPAIVPAKD